MERENGYYWVKFEDPEDKWTILKWSVDCWWAGEFTYTDSDFKTINERRIINPDEKSNCNKTHTSKCAEPVSGRLLINFNNKLSKYQDALPREIIIQWNELFEKLINNC